jgi:hypothetical protein
MKIIGSIVRFDSFRSDDLAEINDDWQLLPNCCEDEALANRF